jgi:formate dehydrogenase subunit delta
MSSALRAAEDNAPPGSVLDIERILTMAGDIGDFFAPYPPERAAEGVRNHLRSYWEPRMRTALLAAIEAGIANDLPPHVLEGARRLVDDIPDAPSYYGPPKA